MGGEHGNMDSCAAIGLATFVFTQSDGISVCLTARSVDVPFGDAGTEDGPDLQRASGVERPLVDSDRLARNVGPAGLALARRVSAMFAADLAPTVADGGAARQVLAGDAAAEAGDKLATESAKPLRGESRVSLEADRREVRSSLLDKPWLFSLSRSLAVTRDAALGPVTVLALSCATDIAEVPALIRRGEEDAAFALSRRMVSPRGLSPLPLLRAVEMHVLVGEAPPIEETGEMWE